MEVNEHEFNNEKNTDKPGQVKMLPVLRYEQKLWFLDVRLRQLRNVRTHHDFLNLNDFEVEYLNKEVV